MLLFEKFSDFRTSFTRFPKCGKYSSFEYLSHSYHSIIPFEIES